MRRLFLNPILFSLCLIPTALSLWILGQKKESLELAQSKISELLQKAIEVDRQSKINAAILTQIQESDPQYLQKELETLPLLESELKRLETVLTHHRDNAVLSRRLDFLHSGQNHISLNEIKRRTSEKFQEIDLLLSHPVEMDDDDLKIMLSTLEGIPINNHLTKPGRPQILIRDFDLVKEINSLGEEVFLVKYQLLKRDRL